MPSIGNTQIIGGKSYQMYTPAWYAAMDADKARQAGAAGTAAGAGVTALRAAVPDLFPTGGSSASSSSSSSGTPAPRAMFPGGSGSISFGGVPGGVPSGVSGGIPGGPRLSPVDTSAADAAQFARAKDTIGDVTRSSLTGLRSALASRGQLGGGSELRGTERLMTKGAGQLGDVARDRAIQNVENERARAALQFQGDITTRGQDLSASQAANALAARLAEVQYQGDITQRGQDLAAEQNRFSQAMSQQQQQALILDRILNALQPLY